MAGEAIRLNNTMQSLYVLLLFGVVGYGLVKLGFPLAPLILGLILGEKSGRGRAGFLNRHG